MGNAIYQKSHPDLMEQFLKFTRKEPLLMVLDFGSSKMEEKWIKVLLDGILKALYRPQM